MVSILSASNTVRVILRRTRQEIVVEQQADHTRSDYINPIDLCNRLNTYIIPEAAVHAFLTVLFLINGYWIALILNLPLLAWNAKKYVLLHRDVRARRAGMEQS